MAEGAITRRLGRTAGAAAVAAAVLAASAAAGASTGAAAAGASTATSGSARGTAAGTRPGASQLLRLSDFPSGWSSSSATASGAQKTLGARQIASCIGVSPKTIVHSPPHASSPQFLDTTANLTAMEQVQRYASPSAATGTFDALQNRKAPGCLAAELNKAVTQPSAGSGASAERITVRRVPFKVPRHRSTALVMTVPVRQDGTSVTALVELVLVRSGRANVTLDLGSIGTPFPATLARHLAATAADRLG